MTDLRVGQLVRIKEIPGTRLASKRKPLWGVIMTVWRHDDENETFGRVSILNGPEHHNSKILYRRNVDLPTDKQVPDWVWVELAKRALLGDEG